MHNHKNRQQFLQNLRKTRGIKKKCSFSTFRAGDFTSLFLTAERNERSYKFGFTNLESSGLELHVLFLPLKS